VTILRRAWLACPASRRARRPRGRERPELSDEADPADRRLRRGRADGRDRPPAGAGHDGRARPDRRRREQDGRQRADRDRSRRPRGTRRLNAAMPTGSRRRESVNGRARDGDEARGIHFLKRFTVFNTEQCEGLPEGVAPGPSPLPENLILPQVEELIGASGADFRIGGYRAFYDVRADLIPVPPPQAFHVPATCTGHSPLAWSLVGRRAAARARPLGLVRLEGVRADPPVSCQCSLSRVSSAKLTAEPAIESLARLSTGLGTGQAAAGPWCRDLPTRARAPCRRTTSPRARGRRSGPC